MRSRFLFTAALLAATPALAQKSPKESTQIWLGIHGQITAASQYSFRVMSSVPGESDPL